MSEIRKKPRTRRDILERLKIGGASDATALAEEMALTPMAVRQHLYELQAEGLVEAREEARPVGRPAKLWFLTGAAERFFPDAHADLAVGLIETVRNALGPAALDRLIAERSHQQIAFYRADLDRIETLEDKLKALMEIRTREGYMAALECSSEGFLFIENHCPICSAARACSGLCAMELQVFQAAIGPDAVVERTDHILAGARRCAYRVTPSSGG